MDAAQTRVLSARDAASIIYNTPDPSEDQVNKVRVKLVRGVLRASGNGRWTTTQQAVAEYLTGQAVGRAGPSRRAAAIRPSADNNALSGQYRRFLTDYFLALALRRRIAYRSHSFHRAALIGQILVVLAGMILVFQSYRAIVRVTTTPEQRAVLAWLDENVGRYQAVEWLPAAPAAQGALVRVRYKYFQNRKGIHTRREFIVRDGKVIVSDADDQ
ncbi:MAG: hypothetical protein AB7O62_16340 [Pirellulales bacterium]